MHYATETGSLPLDFELYLPEVLTNDPDRCQRAGIPSDVTYQPKWKQALAMLDRVRAWELPDQVVGADSGYGKVCEFRDELTKRQLLYVVGVDAETGVWIPPVEVAPKARTSNRGRAPTRFDYGNQKPPSVLDVARGLPDNAWQTVTCAEGSKKKPLQSGFAVLRVHPSHGFHEGKPLRPLEWLLIEWPEEEAEPTHYWLSTLPDSISLRCVTPSGGGTSKMSTGNSKMNSGWTISKGDRG